MYIQDSNAGQVTGNRLVKGFMQLMLESATGLRPLLRGLQIIIGLTLASTAAAQTDLLMNGSSVYSDLGRDQFAAALYLETRQNNADIAHSIQGAKRMEVRVLNNYSKRRWFNLWMQSISINNSRESFSKSAQDLISLMQAAKSAPQKGDFIEYLSSPDRGTSMRFNGIQLITGLPNEVFGLLLHTWIGAIPPTTSFKDEILGNQPNLQANELLETVTTDPQRIALVKSWMKPPKPVAVAKVAEQPAVKKNTKAKAIAALKPKASPEPTVVKPSAPATSVVATTVAAVTATELPAAIADTTVENPLSKDSSPSVPDTLTAANSDSEDDIDFSVAEALAMRDYTPRVVQAIYKKISYPSRAIDRGYEGTVRMSIIVSKNGALEQVTVAQKSRHSLLNQAAIRATERAAPFPELPADLNTDQFEITVPITFKLK
jgi:protein TonB